MTVKEDQASRLITRSIKAYGDRMPELLAVLGSGKALPRNASLPPHWAQQLLKKKVMSGPLGYIDELKLRGRKTNYTLAEWGKILGILSGYATFLASPPEETLREEKEFPPFRTLREGIAEKAESLMPRLIKRKKIRIPVGARRRKKAKADKGPLTLNSKQKVQFEFGYNEGLRRALDEHGQPVIEEQLTYDLCYVMWLFWPEVKDLSKVRELHTWLSELTRKQFSVKLVEKICREIGLTFRPRGKPAKKFLPGLSKA